MARRRKGLPTRAQRPAIRPRMTPVVRALVGGRLSKDSLYGSDVTFGATTPVIIPPVEPEAMWALQELDTNAVRRMSPSRLLSMLVDMSPEMSRALWDILRMLNPGWEVTVYTPGGTNTPHVLGQAEADAIVARVGERYGSFDVVLNRLHLAAFLRGAYCSELVMDAAGQVVIDLACPDPATIRFKMEEDPLYGQVYVPHQWQSGERGLVRLDRPTFRYLPIDPLPGVPYGRAPVAPALFSTLFLIGLLHDLRRVVAQQGYPRYDVSILLDRLMQQMPSDLQNDPEAYRNWIDSAIAEVEATYSRLQPDDAWIHTDTVQINRPVGTVDTSSLGAVDGLLTFLERQAMRALKTMPLLMGSTEGTSEANANRQWELMAAAMKSLQHLAENLLGYFFKLGLRAKGIQAEVVFRFGELRAAEMMRDEQTRRLRNLNTAFEYWMGWIAHNQAAQVTVGHEPAEPAPLLPGIGWSGGKGGAPGAAPDAQENPEPGANRAPTIEAVRAALAEYLHVNGTT